MTRLKNICRLKLRGFHMQVQTALSGQSAKGRSSRESYVVEEVTFRKTIAGHHEFEHRHVLNRPELRRLLILIDGKKAVDELVSYFRAFELAGLLDELLALGMIEPVSSSEDASEVTVRQAIGQRSSLKPQQFESARRAALHAATELLGVEARRHLAELGKCQDSIDLRAVLEKIQQQLKTTLGGDAAVLFIQTVREAVKTSR
jgi:hypothetical protein